MPHQGTFNANPITAAAGLATLKLVAESDAIARANRAAERLRDRLNEVIAQAGSPGSPTASSPAFTCFTNPRTGRGVDGYLRRGVPADGAEGCAGRVVCSRDVAAG